MTRINVATIVEGHGEQKAVPVLLDRVWREVVGGEYVHLIRPPIRRKRNRIISNKDADLTNSVLLAVEQLKANGLAGVPSLVMIMIDADKDCPKELAPNILQMAKAARPDWDVSCVVANIEFETWFVAAAESLSKFIELPPNFNADDPEGQRRGKGWVSKHFRATRYSETIDQPKFAAAMDMSLCRKRSPSFDKLCREMENRAGVLKR